MSAGEGYNTLQKQTSDTVYKGKVLLYIVVAR